MHTHLERYSFTYFKSEPCYRNVWKQIYQLHTAYEDRLLFDYTFAVINSTLH